MWLVAGNRCLQCDDVGKVNVLDEDDGMNFGGGMRGCMKYLKRGWNGKNEWEIKFLKNRGMLGKGGAFKGGL